MSAFHLLLLLDLQMTYMTMFSAIVNIICSRVWFFDHIFLELVGNLTLLTKYLIEKRDDALDNNYCSKVFFLMFVATHFENEPRFAQDR